MTNWDEESHQQFLRIKHPNYYEMDHEEHKRRFEEAKHKSILEALQRIAATVGVIDPYAPSPVRTTVIADKQETIDTEYEVVSSTPLTHDDER